MNSYLIKEAYKNAKQVFQNFKNGNITLTVMEERIDEIFLDLDFKLESLREAQNYEEEERNENV